MAPAVKRRRPALFRVSMGLGFTGLGPIRVWEVKQMLGFRARISALGLGFAL